MDGSNVKKIHSGILVSITIFFVFLGVAFWATTPVDSASSVKPTPTPRPTVPQKRVPILKLQKPITRILGTGMLYKKYPQGSNYLSVVQFATLPYEQGSDKSVDFLANNSIGVFLRPDVTIASLNSFLRETKAEVMGFSGSITRYLSLRIPKVTSVKELFNKLAAVGNKKKYPFVELAVPAIQFIPAILDTQGNAHWSSYYDVDDQTKGSNKALKMTKLLSAANARYLCDNSKYKTACNKGFSIPYTLVMDSGLDIAHPDNPENIQVSGENPQDDVEKLRHGTAVVSVAGGRWGNAQGMEGSNATPDPRVAFQRFDFDSADDTRSYVDAFDQIATGRDGLVSIANFSLGLSPQGIVVLESSDSDSVALAIRARIKQRNAAILIKLNEIDQLRQPNPAIPSFYIVAAASNYPEVSRDARKGSAFCEVASNGTNKTALCVGNYDADQARVISADQNITIAAPGTNVFVAIPTLASQEIGRINNQSISGSYDLMTGTSFATPLVSGILGYLRQFTDASVFTQLKDIAVDTARTDLPGKIPVIDAYAMYWEIGNRRFGNTKPNLLRYYLADVDDRLTSPETYPDGNTRQLEDGTLVTKNSKREERGDGVLDMRDFRVLRDLFAQYLLSSTGLNGGATNPKNDFNGDGCVFGSGQPCRAKEGYYSWLDLNGDGDTDPHKQAPAPRGIPGPTASDLFIFRTLVEEYAQRPNLNVKKNDPRLSSLDGLLEGYNDRDLIDLSPRRALDISPWKEGLNIRGGSGDLNIKGVFLHGGNLAYDEIQLSFSPIGMRPTNTGAWTPTTRKIKEGVLEKITHTVPTKPIRVGVAAYNNGKLVQPIETFVRCTAHGKRGVQKITEKLVFYLTSIGKGVSQSSEKLPTDLSPLRMAEDQYFTVAGEKETTPGDCETAETKAPTTDAPGGNGGGATSAEPGGCPANTYTNTCRYVAPYQGSQDPRNCAVSECYPNHFTAMNPDGSSVEVCDIVDSCHPGQPETNRGYITGLP